MGEALPESLSRHGIRDRDSPGVQGGRLRSRSHAEFKEQEERLRAQSEQLKKTAKK
jgi:hypothetical protein